MGNSPRDCGPGGQWLGFIFIWWGIVLMGSCPRTARDISGWGLWRMHVKAISARIQQVNKSCTYHINSLSTRTHFST